MGDDITVVLYHGGSLVRNKSCNLEYISSEMDVLVIVLEELRSRGIMKLRI